MDSQSSPTTQASSRHLPEDTITLWTATTPLERARAVRWFAARPASEQMAIIAKGAQDILPNLQKANQEQTHDCALRYAAFVLAIRRSGYDLTRKRGGNTMADKDFETLTAMRRGVMESLRSRKKSPLRHTLLSLWGEIKALKQDGSGFLLISRYLARTHNIKASPSYIARLWREVEG